MELSKDWSNGEFECPGSAGSNIICLHKAWKNIVNFRKFSRETLYRVIPILPIPSRPNSSIVITILYFNRRLVPLKVLNMQASRNELCSSLFYTKRQTY